MKFKFKGEKAIEIGMLGKVEPGQEFDINNEKFLPIFKNSVLFEELKPKKVVKKEEVKEEE